MMGFYVILLEGRSLEDIARCLGSSCPCALYYNPSAPVRRGEACELLAQPDATSAHLRLSVPSFVESDVTELVQGRFGDQPVSLYQLIYTDVELLRALAPHFMADPLVYVIDEAGVEAGADFLGRLLAQPARPGGSGG